MSQAIPAKTDQFRGKLARTMLGVLLPLSLIPLLILGGVAYARSRQVLLSQLRTTLISIDGQHQENIAGWVELREERMDGFYIDPDYREAIEYVSQSNGGNNAEFSVARKLILDNLAKLNSPQHFINQFFLVSPDGVILVASNPSLEGLAIDNSSYYKILSSEENAASAFFQPDPIYNSLAFILTRPYYDAQGNHLATFWAMTGFSLFEELVNDINFLDIRAFVITEANDYIGLGANTKEIIDGPTLDPSQQQEQILSERIDAASPHVVEYPSFDGEIVLAIYTPIPKFKAGLVTEIPTTAIIRQLQNFPLFGLLITATILLSGLLIYVSTRRFIQPILDVATSAQHFSEGDWQKRASTNRKDEIGLLAHSFNQMADEISTLYRSLESQVHTRTEQIRTAAEVAQIATSASSLDVVLKQTVELIVERFGYYYSAIFLLDEFRENALLRASYSETKKGSLQTSTLGLEVGSGSIIGQVALDNLPYVAADVSEDPYYLYTDQLPETRSEVGIPLSIGDNILGVLDVQSSRVNAFEEESIATLQTLANQIASALQNIYLLETARTDLMATSTLYQASHFIAQSENKDQVFKALISTLDQIPYISALFKVEPNRLEPISVIDPIRKSKHKALSTISVPTQELNSSLSKTTFLTIKADDQTHVLPNPVLALPEELDCPVITLFPIHANNNLEALLILGTADPDKFSSVALEPYNSLIDITQTALEKVNALSLTQQRLTELESISTVGQSIATETDIQALYEIIHGQIIQAIGNINFLIALYHPENNTIAIPYLEEEGVISSIDPFPLGEGLTSIVIRTMQPLMIIEDTENRSKALGAKVTKTGFAKSWLGVPLIVSGEIIGAMVVQDMENEHRFDEDDLRLITTLASQIAIAIRNARFIESAERRAEQERQLYQITSQLRRSPDIQSILKTTAQELGKVLNAHRTHIELSLDTNDKNMQAIGSYEKEVSE